MNPLESKLLDSLAAALAVVRASVDSELDSAERRAWIDSLTRVSRAVVDVVHGREKLTLAASERMTMAEVYAVLAEFLSGAARYVDAATLAKLEGLLRDAGHVR